MGVRVTLNFRTGRASDVSGVAFCAAALDDSPRSGLSLTCASLVGASSSSIGVSLRYCSGVRVSGMGGGLFLYARYGVSCCPFRHCSVGWLKWAGVVTFDDAATRSSEERFVWENDGDGVICALGNPDLSIIESMASWCMAVFSEVVLDEILKSSRVSGIVNMLDVSLVVISSAVSPLGLPLAHSQMARCEGVCCIGCTGPPWPSPSSPLTTRLSLNW